jgi:hypothetical protein
VHLVSRAGESKFVGTADTSCGICWPGISLRHLFLASLVCNVEPSVRILSVMSPVPICLAWYQQLKHFPARERCIYFFVAPERASLSNSLVEWIPQPFRLRFVLGSTYRTHTSSNVYTYVLVLMWSLICKHSLGFKASDHRGSSSTRT